MPNWARVLVQCSVGGKPILLDCRQLAEKNCRTFSLGERVAGRPDEGPAVPNSVQMALPYMQSEVFLDLLSGEQGWIVLHYCKEFRVQTGQ